MEGRQETILEILGIIAADQESDVDTADPQAVPINDALLRAAADRLGRAPR